MRTARGVLTRASAAGCTADAPFSAYMVTVAAMVFEFAFSSVGPPQALVARVVARATNVPAMERRRAREGAIGYAAVKGRPAACGVGPRRIPSGRSEFKRGGLRDASAKRVSFLDFAPGRR